MYPKLYYADENNIQEAAFHKESIIEIGESGKQEETFHEGYADETKGKGMLVGFNVVHPKKAPPCHVLFSVSFFF